eukprot:CAMPEP_0172356910 /NCGR_PEP_ID=MMETSP1060-20121228/1289_1 /TAXON_ID=37318 /ORGANISM="Pseudo-nitzschia pungens, Strain cf. cingulata" /LENGTH=189 /DNA_ID=CAMNT_0013077303 /DNA_START=245 /DNA_END=814 /DNA_ORIENTATION=-
MTDDEQATTTPPVTAAASTKNVVHWQEVHDTVSRLASHKGVLAVSILNSQGNIVTHQVTTAGAERARSAEASGSGGGSSTAAPSILGNPHLLTQMMKSANQYVLSLSGPRAEDPYDNDNDNNDDDNSDDNSDDDDDDNDDASSASAPSRSNTEENISFVRIRTRKDEILVAPKLGYTLVVLQDPSISAL